MTVGVDVDDDIDGTVDVVDDDDLVDNLDGLDGEARMFMEMDSRIIMLEMQSMQTFT